MAQRASVGTRPVLSRLNMFDDVTKSAPPVPPVNPPKTGDSSEPGLWMAAWTLALLGMVSLALRRRKKRKA